MKHSPLIAAFAGILFCLSPMAKAQTPTPSTLHADLQALASRMLNGKQGSIVAIAPATGEIICLASASVGTDSVNRAVETAYLPGSTFKVAQALAMVSEGVLGKSSRYPCSKGFYRAGIHIGCHAHTSPQALVGAIGHSCNSYFCRAFADMVGNSKYNSYAEAIDKWHARMASYGLGQPLGADIPGEVAGLIPTAAYLTESHHGQWGPTAIMWMGMGQGEVTATPLQLCNLAAMIANRGFFYTPHLQRGTAESPLPDRFLVRHNAMATPEAIEVTIEGMRAAVVSGTCAAINRAAYKICGKTGTAENEGDDHSLFIGFAPMENPQIAVAVVVDNAGFGADVAAPIGSLIIEQALTGRLREFSEYQVASWEAHKVNTYQPKAETEAAEAANP